MGKKQGCIVDFNRIEKTVWNLAEPLVAESGAQLIDVEFLQEAGSWYLRIFIDREPAVDHELCQSVSEKISDALDIADPISQSYYLEISSPGLERPLRREEDLHRYAGRLIAVRLYAPLLGKKEFTGILLGAEEGCLKLDEDGEIHSFPLEQVAKAHLIADL